MAATGAGLGGARFQKGDMKALRTARIIVAIAIGAILITGAVTAMVIAVVNFLSRYYSHNV